MLYDNDQYDNNLYYYVTDDFKFYHDKLKFKFNHDLNYYITDDFNDGIPDDFNDGISNDNDGNPDIHDSVNKRINSTC